MQRLDGIDYADAHTYPLRSGAIRTAATLARFIDDRVQLAHHVAHKPLVWGEYGFSAAPRTVGGRGRSAWFDAFLTASHRDGVDGALVWQYAPHEARATSHAIYTDGEGDTETRDVRRVLARHAGRWRQSPPVERNPRLGQAQGELPLAPLDQVLRGGARPHADWAHAANGAHTLVIAPSEFASARFEAAGVWAEAPVAHLWGAIAGEVQYRFRAPAGEGVPARLVIRFRASSELPGQGAGSRASDVSHVHVSIGDVELGVVVAPVDDGRGAWLELRVDDPLLLRRALVSRTATHALRLRVAPGEDARGLCLYAQDFEHPETPPGHLELLWEAGPPAERERTSPR